MAELTLHEHEQRALLQNPAAIVLLMDWHDYQQTCADAIEMGCHGNERRHQELKAHGRAIVLNDPDLYGTDVVWAFGLTRSAGVPGVRDRECEHNCMEGKEGKEGREVCVGGACKRAAATPSDAPSGAIQEEKVKP